MSTRISELSRRNTNLLVEISSHESHIDSLNTRIAIVEENYASGEQTRIANELSRVNARKSDLETLYTTIMNEYRDKDSQLTTLQTEENRKKSQIKSLYDEEIFINITTSRIGK